MNKAVLYLVGTPIGNLEDISHRALSVLKEVDIVAAEDTRQTKKLLFHYQIKTAMISYHDYNKIKATVHLVNLLQKGKSVGLVCDRGMPGIADPAYYLINRAIEKGIRIIPVPGPTASISCLVASGLPTDRFAFEGFIPRKAGKRRTFLEKLAKEERTIVFYESPHRLEETLKEMQAVWGERKMALGRELTKKFEEVIRGNLSEIIAHFENVRPRGEFTLVIAGNRTGNV